MNKILITGTSGFIGFHLANLLLKKGFDIYGLDGITNYYDVNLKKKRNEILLQYSKFFFKEEMLENFKELESSFIFFKPDVVVHLAAQAGVRYSLENPRSYIDSNIIGTFNILEMAKKYNVKHLLIASTSSVYGSNTNMPFEETSKADTQLTIYAATKKASESMAHSYSHLWKIPTTIFRFFTVYGPWGRPDMALFKFVSAILDDKPIDIYNQGEMYRDFTFVEDLVSAIDLLIDKVPNNSEQSEFHPKDSLSRVAPFRIVNIGNSKKIKLIDFIEIIEEILQKKAIKNFMPIQKGDVQETWADTTLLKHLTDFNLKTDVKEGILKFVEWYKDYYKI